MLISELSIEKHDQNVERDAWLVMNLCLDFHAHSNEKQHFAWFHLCNFPYKNRLLRRFCMKVMDFSPSKGKAA